MGEAFLHLSNIIYAKMLRASVGSTVPDVPPGMEAWLHHYIK